MYATRADDGLICSLPLVLQVDDESSGIPLCWQEGIEGFKTRVKILETARNQKVSLFKLHKSFKVKWHHFEEWASILRTGEEDEVFLSACDKVLYIFANHLWADELCGEGPQFEQLRRDLGVTDAGGIV
jgi:hypothetical protein